MATSKALEVEGLEQLSKSLDQLQLYASSDIIKRAVKVAATVVAEEAKTLVPVKTGALRRAIKVRAGRSGKGRVTFLAGVGKQWFVGDFFYGAFQEFGWKSGKRGRRSLSNKPRKQIPGYHYMEYAFEEKAQAAMSALLQTIRAGLEQEASRGTR